MLKIAQVSQHLASRPGGGPELEPRRAPIRMMQRQHNEHMWGPYTMHVDPYSIQHDDS